MAKEQAKNKKGDKKQDAGAAKAPVNAEMTAEEKEAFAGYVPNLRQKYHDEIIAKMQERFQYKNVNQVPKIEKIVVNMGVGEAARDAKLIDSAAAELTQITGQKARITKASKSISAFKLREGRSVGCFVTLRGNRMYEFIERLTKIAIPRIRDFRGLPYKSFDGRGNHSMGIREHMIFLELDFNKVQSVRGLNITTVTSAKTDEEARVLLKLMGYPIREK